MQFDPLALLTPFGAAILAEIVALWLERYLEQWRWRPVLLLVIMIAAQIAARAAFGVALVGAEIVASIWHGLLGASVATFSREVVLNIMGMFDSGPRDTLVDVQLGRRWS
jgi:hypothetical protein